jgi:hypothetical protein
MIKTIRMRWTGHVEHIEKRNAYRVPEGNPCRKRPPEGLRWEDNIKMDHRKI